jgi:hypothetical protein
MQDLINIVDQICYGTDLPHLIADGRWTHAAEFILPGFGFIYILDGLKLGWTEIRTRS